MFDLGWPEILVIAIVLIVVVGPKDLPGMLRSFGRTTSKLREMAGDFRKQFDDALKEAELDEVKNIVGEAKKYDPRGAIRKGLSPLEEAGKQVRSGLDGVMKPKGGNAGEPAASEARPAEPQKTAATAMPGEASKSKAAAKPKPAAKKPKPAAKAKTPAKPAARAAPGKPAAKAKPAKAAPAKRKPAAAGKGGASKPAAKAKSTGTAS